MFSRCATTSYHKLADRLTTSQSIDIIVEYNKPIILYISRYIPVAVEKVKELFTRHII